MCEMFDCTVYCTVGYTVEVIYVVADGVAVETKAEITACEVFSDAYVYYSICVFWRLSESSGVPRTETQFF
jgi:hypothetical protein